MVLVKSNIFYLNPDLIYFIQIELYQVLENYFINFLITLTNLDELQEIELNSEKNPYLHYKVAYFFNLLKTGKLF